MRADERAARRRKEEDKERRRAHRDEKRRLRLERLIRTARQQRAELRAAALGSAAAATTVTLDYAAHEVRLLAGSEMEREWRAQSCAKEPWTVAWLEESLRDGGVLYDIGANVGSFALIAAKICGDRGTVVAFEPGYASFAHLCDNIVLNRCQDVIVPLPLALGSTTTLGTFIYRTLHAGQSRHDFADTAWSPVRASASPRYHQPILSMRLDDVVRQFGLPRPNHIKVDVDGSELNVLRGAPATLSARELRSVLIEIDDSLSAPAVEMLAGHGFALEETHKHVHRERTQVWYGVFRRR